MAVTRALATFLYENTSTLLLFGAGMIVFLAVNRSRTKSIYSIPKGPAPVPFFGNLLSLEKNDGFLDQLIAWGKEFGPVFTVYFGNKQTLIVNGMEAIKEVTLKTGMDFGDRPESVVSLVFNPKRLGLFDTMADDSWKSQRKFAHTTLRGMGFGKVSLEPIILTEALKLIEHFKSQQGMPINPQTAFGISAYNIISRLVFSHHINHGSEYGEELMNNVRVLVTFDDDVILTLFPSLWHVVKHTGKWTKIDRALENVMKVFEDAIRVRQERINATTGEPEINDFIDAYLVHMRSDPENYTLEALYFTLIDLYLAGTDTVSTTLTWATIYLASNPEIQRKIHAEIIEEIGTSKQVSMSDRSRLNYTRAALLEIQRLATVAPLIPRMAAKDTTLAGHKLPKGTEILLNFWSIHHDPEVWSDPNRFNPGRFLKDDSTVVRLPENYMPFSAGKRVCMGEQLAKMELFLFLTSVIQHLKFSIPDGCEVPSFEAGSVDAVRQPKPFKIQISPWSD